ncbi:Mov34-domain-containing protein [Jaminaea rosea]|uniref:COP9 signalosome complex subunit 5 n=1 Tax=Jaminaea rosea TaxID=1569628 RepID=A0A316UXN0_9BASI|nr:Mov34-domain-containing protein [Jaminaea rosea]PWN29538.1 Mov34-domain-containing protein [Jaminaea rosea]
MANAGPSGSSSSASMARANFELNNDMIDLDPAKDAIFHFDNDQQKQALNAAPWKKDPHFFQTVRISAVALIKMVMHARSGGIYEIMGLMQGKIDIPNRTLWVMDAFALPVQGTETRVNAQNEAYEYMVEYLESSKQVGRLENAIGWYHSHPGYGCWLSGIDVNTQMTNQQFQDPFVAVVIDPNRTISAGRVDIGAFRTYPKDYTPPNASSSEYQSIPLDKIEDFGVHANSYYPLKVEHFKSSLDEKLLGMLWEKYWIATLSQSPLVVNRDYMTGQTKDLAEKLAQTRRSAQGRSITTQPVGKGGGGGGGGGNSIVPGSSSGDDRGGSSSKSGSTSQPPAVASTSSAEAAAENAAKMANDVRKREDETPLNKVVRDGSKLSTEAQHGLMTQVLKDILFNRASTGAPLPSF